MKIIRPIVIAGALLAASNVAEAAPAAYNGGTTYALGDKVSVLAGYTYTVYRSLQAGNVGHTPASSPTWWEETSLTYGEWSSGTTYAAGDRVIIAATHREYESLQAGNLNNAPAASPAWWLDRGATNRWRMFDESPTSQTLNKSSIEAQFALSERADSVALLNVSALTARVKMTVPGDGVVFDETYPLVSDSGITDWWSYFFEPVVRLADLLVTGLPPYASSTVDVTLAAASEDVKAGVCIVGLSREIGETQYGATVGIQDYSIKQKDDFGNYTVLERAYANRASFTIWLDARITAEVKNLLAQYRATPILYVGEEQETSTIVYGFYKDFNVEIANPGFSICSLEVEGLA